MNESRTFVVRTFAFVVVAIASASGCKSTPADTQTAAASSSATSTGASAIASGIASSSTIGNAPPPSATVVAMPNLPMGERFAMEAQARPAGAIKAENVYSAINDAGFAVTEQKQHLASPFGARFCYGAKIADTQKMPQMDASVCEYISDDVARIGHDRSLEGFKIIPNRSVTQNKQTTLTLREYTKNDVNDALVQKVIAVFQKL